jgi:hypothetical protein
MCVLEEIKCGVRQAKSIIAVMAVVAKQGSGQLAEI